MLINYRIYSRIGRNFFLIFFNKKHGCDLSARHTLKVFGYCKYRIFRLISRYGHELRLRLCSHIPMRDSFMRAHAHATAQRALDFPALLRKNGFCDFKGGESSSQFQRFAIGKIELYFLIFFALILRLRLQRYSTNTKRCPPEKRFWKL